MMYCPRCGVVLSDAAEVCPLCGTRAEIGAPPSVESGGLDYPSGTPSRFSRKKESARDEVEVDLDESLSVAERSRIAVELLSVAAGVALVVTLLADLFAEHAIGWSRYTFVGILSAWLFTAMPLILRRHPWILFAILAPSSLLFVFLWDIFDGKLSWFLQYGLPIALLVEGCAAGTGAIIAAMRRKGLNIVAAILAGSSVFCVGLETILSLNTLGHIFLTWSVITSLALIPTAALLFYLHYRIVNRASLRKLFRL